MFTFLPLTVATWDDLVELFGDKGACGGCWCMYWRLKAADYNKQKGDGNKLALKKLLKKTSPGIIAYAENKAVGWCAVAPREEYKRLETSRILKPVDDEKVWSVSCFFIAKEFRRKGLSVSLLKAAVDFAIAKGAAIVEGYPTDPANGRIADAFVWTGIAATFQKAGFKEVERRSETRPVMRFYKK
ncbi:GNAT family N-acetyltransferase [Terrimonas pollutisoli]|uniref:GNAT family N-acetyltransferase n=1 Tax=Terrimonas pollutisoli TaxID=3034147 RepID=UPI0023EDBCB5|nr:GNAT family N-acetyltransferase [Terrimonas sp. H1YJ31]